MDANNTRSSCLPRRASMTSGVGVGILAIAIGVGAPSNADGQSRITGGREVKSLSENPGAVGLHVKVNDPNNGGMVCGANRIAPDWVLTAKHCVRGNYEYTTVTTHTIRRSEGPRAPIEKVIPHPRNVDLALIKLATKDSPGPILTWSDSLMKKGDPVRIYGWGYTRPTPSASLILKVADGQVYQFAKNPINDSSGNYTEGTSVMYRSTDGLCLTGDSGGPMINAAGQLVAVASTSSYTGSGVNGECGYTSLHHEGAWIKEVTGIQAGTTYPALPNPKPTPTGTEPAPGSTPFPAPTRPA